jgi:hypothetical protein
MDAEQVLAVAPEQVQRSTRREASLLPGQIIRQYNFVAMDRSLLQP